MSYQPYDRKPSGIVFFGNSAADQVYESVANFVYNSGTNTLQVPNVTASNTVTANSFILSNNSTIGSTDTTNAITIASDGSVSILKNLTVNGTTTTVNSTTLTVQDPIIVLGSGTPTLDDNKDRGISFNYYDGSAKVGFFGYDDSSGKFMFVPDATISNEVVSGAAGTIVANLQGNADTATKWANAINLQVADQVTGSGNLDGSSNLSINVQLTHSAINGQTETNTANSGDYLLIASGSALRKISKSNFVSDLGTLTSFGIKDLDNDSATIGNSGLVLYSGVNNNARVKFDVSANGPSGIVAADLVANSISETYLTSSVAGVGLSGGNGSALTLDLSEYSTVALASGDSFLMLDSDGATEQRSTISDLGSYLAGSGLSANAAGVLSVNVDNTTVELNSGTLRIKDKGVTDSKLRDSTGLSVIGRSADTTGAPADIVASTDGHVLRRNGTSVGFGTVTSAGIADGAITESKLSRTIETATSSKTADKDITVVDATGGSVTVTLPTGTTAGKVMVFKRKDASSNNVIIQRGGTDTIDGSTEWRLYHVYETLTMVSDGASPTSWYII